MSLICSFQETEVAELQGENPLPYFRATQHDQSVEVCENFPESYKTLLGSETGFRMLPYRKQDRYTRKRTLTQMPIIILENDRLKAQFLPQYGARLSSLLCKKTGKELLYNNALFQPANLAIRNAWFSGGIEWNIGQFGHTFTTCSPVFCAKVTDPSSGEIFLRIYEYERCKGVYWQIDFHLPDGSDMLYAYTRIINPNAHDVPMYWWTNIALPETEQTRVFAPSSNVLYLDPFTQNGKKRFGYARLPSLKTAPHCDASYPAQSPYSNEYFFLCENEKMPWEATIEKDGSGFLEVSTDMLKYRKMFCWGSLSGGAHWAEFLGYDRKTKKSKYFESQAGLAPTQMHGLRMKAHTQWEWTQGFAGIQLDATQSHAPWQSAQPYIKKSVSTQVSCDDLYAKHRSFATAANIPTNELLSHGSGWGALEAERRTIQEKSSQHSLPASFYFPTETLGDEQKPWRTLLHDGILPSWRTTQVPHAYMTSSTWENMLTDSLKNHGAQYTDDNKWNALLHLGVAAMERNDIEAAQAYWEASNNIKTNAWALRNCAIIEKTKKNSDTVLYYYKKALETDGGKTDIALSQEYLSQLVLEKQWNDVFDFYHSLPNQWKQDDTCLIQYAFCMAAQGNTEEVLRILAHDFANIREGDTPLTDLWTAIKGVEKPPYRLDFRMVNCETN